MPKNDRLKKKIRDILTEIAWNQATCPVSSKEWLQEIKQKIDKI